MRRIDHGDSVQDDFTLPDGVRVSVFYERREPPEWHFSLFAGDIASRDALLAACERESLVCEMGLAMSVLIQTDDAVLVQRIGQENKVVRYIESMWDDEQSMLLKLFNIPAQPLPD